MTVTEVLSRPRASEMCAKDVFDGWILKANEALDAKDGAFFAELFTDSGYWRDILSFTWDRRVFTGHTEISSAFQRTASFAGAANIRVAANRTAPRLARRSGRAVLEAWFDFDTAVGTGAGFARFLYNDTSPEDSKVWLLLTTLHELRGAEERVVPNRPTGEHYSKIQGPNSWKQEREREQRFEDRDPEVLIVGAGQGGLILAARLRQLGVDALVVEKSARVGDVWRKRYNNLTLHNKLDANHFPYLAFPTTWPVWLPKDMLADWLEGYAKFLELNVWTSTQFTNASRDEKTGEWSATLQLEDGSERVMRSKHLVLSTGVSGGVPKKPDIPGLADFAGCVVHSGAFTSGSDYKGRNAIVIGTGNSGHDIAQDLYVSGANAVSLMQRGPTCVVSVEPSATISYAVYSQDLPVEDVDLMVAAVPYPMLIETYQWITKKTSQLDRPLLDGLHSIGFKTHVGKDETGFQLLYLRGAGGYYIDVGCSQLLIERKIGLLQAEDMERFVPEGLMMRDGSVVPCNLVVLATGFESIAQNVRRLLGDAVADRVGPVWGFDDQGNVRNMWTITEQPGLSLMGGAIIESRFNSRFLALEIKASLAGLLPDPKDRPLAASEGASQSGS